MQLLSKTLPLVVLSCALALTACKKDGPSGASADAIANIPAGISMVLNIDFAKARGSDVWKKYESKMDQEMPKQLVEFKAECGMDPTKDISNAMIGLGMTDPENEMAVVISGNFDKAKIENCIKKIAEKEGEKFETETDGKLTIYKMNGEEAVLYFPTDNTVVLSKGAWGRTALKAVADGKSVKDDSTVMEVVGKVDSGSIFWVAGKIPAELGENMPMGSPPKTVYASVKANNGVELNGAMLFESDDQVTGMKAMADMVLMQAKSQPQAADLLQNVSIEADGKALKINGKLSMDQLAKLEEMAGQLPM